MTDQRDVSQIAASGLEGDAWSSPDAGFFRHLFDVAGIAMVAADLHGRITAWNLAAARMFGAGTNEMVGTDWAHIVPVEERRKAKRMLSETLDHGTNSEFDFYLRDEHGSVRRLAAIVTAIVNCDGDRTGGLACIRDITNRMRLENRLAQKSKMAALGELAGALAHHFNNILGGVVTSVDFALASRDPNTITRVMEKSATALSRATELVDSLLAFAEGDFRNAGLSDLGEIVIRAVERAETELRGTPVSLVTDVHPVPIVEVPGIQFTTVLMNLIHNAEEAMPDGGTLTIGLTRDADDVLVSIADTGCGLDEASLTRIFEPFFSTKRPSEQDRPGRGLGLAVAHGILKVMHGTIEVSSRLGRGTVFEVRVPLLTSQAADPVSRAASSG